MSNDPEATVLLQCPGCDGTWTAFVTCESPSCPHCGYRMCEQPDEEDEYDPTPAQCCECEEEAVGYSEGEAYCAAHYRSRS